MEMISYKLNCMIINFQEMIRRVGVVFLSSNLQSLFEQAQYHNNQQFT